MEKYKKEDYYDSMGINHKKKEISLIKNNIDFYKHMIAKLK